MRKPNPGVVPPKVAIPNAMDGAPRRWAFSMRFWQQIANFGCDGVDSKWFVAVLERLRDLGGYTIDEFMEDGPKKERVWRYHEIDWDGKNVPLTRKEINWLHKDYLDNPEEYPFFQFQISKALGRLVGFWDENQIFNIVLLDPNHNIQPSDYSDYKIRPCGPLECQYTQLLAQMDSLGEGLHCELDQCKVRLSLAKTAANTRRQAVIVPISDDDKISIEEVLRTGRAKSLNAVLVDGLLLSMEKPEVVLEVVVGLDVDGASGPTSAE